MKIAIVLLNFRYKDGMILDLSSGRYLVEGKGGIHSLEIPRYIKFNKG